MSALHQLALQSVVDQMAGRHYLAALLQSGPKIEERPLQYQRKPPTPAQLLQRQAMSAGHQKRQIEIGERVFEAHGWTCDTRQFAGAAKTSRAQAALNRLAALGCVKQIKPAKGTIPAKWKWVRHNAEVKGDGQ